LLRGRRPPERLTLGALEPGGRRAGGGHTEGSARTEDDDVDDLGAQLLTRSGGWRGWRLHVVARGARGHSFQAMRVWGW